MTSIAAGEYAENEIRKDFTPSERVAILETIERVRHGGDRRSGKFQAQKFAVEPEAAARAGFGNKETARLATIVTRKGAP